MVSNYAHVKWVQDLISTLTSKQDDKEFVSELLVGAIEHFKTLSPDDKSDVFVYLLGRWVGGESV